MNKMDRLLSIVLELQSREWTRAEELAAQFEVSKRTIYRDMQALSEAGVPIVAVTGQGYGLMEGYFLPPLNFTADEALMLILGGDYMAQNFDAQYRVAADSASAKIEAVLPQHLGENVAYLRKNIRFFVSSAPHATDTFEPLKQLRRAVIERRRVRLTYTKRFGEDESSPASTRDVDPYSLARLAMDWYLLGFCHLRQDFRVFRLARIDGLTILPQTFARSPEFQPDWMNPSGAPHVVVTVLFKAKVARWVHESNTYYTVEAEETADGLLVTIFVRDEREVLQWLLGWGGNVRVLEPESLCQMLLDEAKRVVALYD